MNQKFHCDIKFLNLNLCVFLSTKISTECIQEATGIYSTNLALCWHYSAVYASTHKKTEPIKNRVVQAPNYTCNKKGARSYTIVVQNSKCSKYKSPETAAVLLCFTAYVFYCCLSSFAIPKELVFTFETIIETFTANQYCVIICNLAQKENISTVGLFLQSSCLVYLYKAVGNISHMVVCAADWFHSGLGIKHQPQCWIPVNQP